MQRPVGSYNEKTKSPTWRELKAVHNMLFSVGNVLRGHHLQWHTDNQNIVHVINTGSIKPDLQSVKEDIPHLCVCRRISIIPVWVPREENHLADYLSKLIDVDNHGTQPHIFQCINNMWGPFTVDPSAA